MEIVIDGTYSSPFITKSVRFIDAKTFHFTQMSVSGYKSHSRKGGWNAGTYNQEDVPFTLQHDRDIEFMIDQADVQETNQTASIKNISRTFVSTQQAPETDAVFFQKVHEAAAKAGMTEPKTLADITKANVLTYVKGIIAKVKKYRNKGLILYVASEIMDLLALSTEVTKTLEISSISESGKGIETRIVRIDGVPIMEVIEDDRFYGTFDYSEGFTGTGNKLLIVAATPVTTKTVPKIQSIYYFAPGSHQKGDGYLYQNRAMWDTFVFPNGKDNKVDSVFTVTVSGTEPAQAANEEGEG